MGFLPVEKKDISMDIGTSPKNKKNVLVVWKENERQQVLHQGVNFLLETVQGCNDEQWKVLGIEAIQGLHDLSRLVSSASTRRRIEVQLEQMILRWATQKEIHSEWKEGTHPTPQQVLEVIRAIYTVEKVGARHGRKQELYDFLSKKPYGPEDYFGWDPSSGPPLSSAEKSKYLLLAEGLVHTYFAKRIGISLGFLYDKIFRCAQEITPYRGSHELSANEYMDQCCLVLRIVQTLTNWGELYISPGLLTHEFEFIRNHMPVHIAKGDIVLTAEMLQCLLLFGVQDTTNRVRRALALLIESQHSSGSWTSPSADLYDKYQCAITAATALVPRSLKGFGPSIIEVVPHIEQQVKAIERVEESNVEHDIRRKKLRSIVKALSKEKEINTVVQPPPRPNNSHDNIKKPLLSTVMDARVKEVNRLKSMLEALSDPSKIEAPLGSNILKQLSRIEMTFDILKDTGIGKSVRKMKKHPATEVSIFAGGLIDKWKKDVSQ